LPSRVLPARPDLWTAYTFEIGMTTNDSMPVSGLYYFYLTRPQSITYPMLSTVREVSAIFVQKIILRHPSGVLINAFAYCSGDCAPYNGHKIIGGTSRPSCCTSESFLKHILVAYSHSSKPVKNTRTSPAGSLRWIRIAAPTAFSVRFSLLLSLCKMLTE
jgi:hypothetical protein